MALAPATRYELQLLAVLAPTLCALLALLAGLWACHRTVLDAVYARPADFAIQRGDRVVRSINRVTVGLEWRSAMKRFNRVGAGPEELEPGGGGGGVVSGGGGGAGVGGSGVVGGGAGVLGGGRGGAGAISGVLGVLGSDGNTATPAPAPRAAAAAAGAHRAGGGAAGSAPPTGWSSPASDGAPLPARDAGAASARPLGERRGDAVAGRGHRARGSHHRHHLNVGGGVGDDGVAVDSYLSDGDDDDENEQLGEERADAVAADPSLADDSPAPTRLRHRRRRRLAESDTSGGGGGSLHVSGGGGAHHVSDSGGGANRHVSGSDGAHELPSPSAPTGSDHESPSRRVASTGSDGGALCVGSPLGLDGRRPRHSTESGRWSAASGGSLLDNPDYYNSSFGSLPTDGGGLARRGAREARAPSVAGFCVDGGGACDDRLLAPLRAADGTGEADEHPAGPPPPLHAVGGAPC